MMSLEFKMRPLSVCMTDRQSNHSENELADCIFDDGPLGFEKGLEEKQGFEFEDPLEEVDLGDADRKRPIYISALLSESFKRQIVDLVSEYKDCFAWDYHEMPGLSRELVEHRLSFETWL